MRKLDKDYDAVPVSLKTDAVSISRDPAKTTHNRRVEVVANGAYVYEAKYDSRYKIVDIKSALEAIHNHKCAYCEFYDQVLHVEHYRPKNGYHWLAYSWDNLLLACQKCNGHKKDQFGLSGVKVNAPADVDYSRIHSLADEYDITLSNHRSTAVRESDIENMDLVLCMTNSHKNTLNLMYPNLSDKIYLIKEYVGLDGEVEDPYGGSLSVYSNCAKDLSFYLDKLLEKEGF